MAGLSDSLAHEPELYGASYGSIIDEYREEMLRWPVDVIESHDADAMYPATMFSAQHRTPASTTAVGG
jgi:hypothetical protein